MCLDFKNDKLFVLLCFVLEWKSPSCPALCDPMDDTVPRILQARTLGWGAFPLSRGSSQPRGRTQAAHIAGGFFTSWATGKPRSRWGARNGPGRQWSSRPVLPRVSFSTALLNIQCWWLCGCLSIIFIPWTISNYRKFIETNVMNTHVQFLTCQVLIFSKFCFLHIKH